MIVIHDENNQVRHKNPLPHENEIVLGPFLPASRSSDADTASENFTNGKIQKQNVQKSFTVRFTVKTIRWGDSRQ
jgi:hypothetical protein